MPVFALWSAPRARSTAFFRSMVERGDVVAVHEPFSDLAAAEPTEEEADSTGPVILGRVAVILAGGIGIIVRRTQGT